MSIVDNVQGTVAVGFTNWETSMAGPVALAIMTERATEDMQ